MPFKGLVGSHYSSYCWVILTEALQVVNHPRTRIYQFLEAQVRLDKIDFTKNFSYVTGSIGTFALNVTDEEPIFFLSSQLMGFLQAYHADFPHLQAVSEMLRISGPDLQLSYSLLNLTPPYIHVDLQLPAGFSVNIEVSREISYSFIQYLWMLQASGVSQNETSQ